MDDKIREIEEIMREELKDSAHDIEHVLRVHEMCLRLSSGEKELNVDVMRVAALLHDIARVKEDTDDTGATDHALLGADMAREILKEKEFSPDFIEAVHEAIRSHRLRSGIAPQSRESQILYDADKLDVLGAVGIARCFMIAGLYEEPLFRKVDMEEYVRENLTGGNHNGRIKDISKHSPNIEFENKLKYLPEKLYTKKARAIASGRLELMSEFFGRLEKEIAGEL